MSCLPKIQYLGLHSYISLDHQEGYVVDQRIVPLNSLRSAWDDNQSGVKPHDTVFIFVSPQNDDILRCQLMSLDTTPHECILRL